MNKDAEQVKAAQRRPRRKEQGEGAYSGLYLPSGCTMYDLALSDKWNGGYALGKVANTIGDSSAGKSIMALTAFAEAARLRPFKDYDLIYDDTEAADEFNKIKLFGPRAAKRIIAPPRTKRVSDTIEELRDNILWSIEKDRPFIWIQDSFDALTSEAEKKDPGKGYGTEKARGASEIMRMISRELKRTQSLLIIISQTRQRIGGVGKTRSGGNAIKFYSSYETWLNVKYPNGIIERKNHTIGHVIRARVTKNKVTGKHRVVHFPVYYDYGIDNTRACVDYLLEEGEWETSKQTIRAALDNGVTINATREKLIRQIEEQGLESDLRQTAGRVWGDVEESLKLGRKPKYE